MNIIIANTQEFNPQIGGVERVSNILASEFVKKGFIVYFVACIKSTYSKQYNTTVEQIILPNNNYYSHDNIEALFQVCKDKKIDIILNQAGNILDFTNLCGAVCSKLNISLVTAIHTNPMNRINLTKDCKYSKIRKYSNMKVIVKLILMPLRYLITYKKDQKLYRTICSLSDKVVLLSEYYKKDIENITKYECGNKIISIPNPISHNLPLRKLQKEKVVLFVGRLDFDNKRPDRLIRIWEKIYKDYPGWKLKLAGDGPFKQQLMNYIKKKKILNIEFLGFCNPTEEYSTASILCSTSTIEGLPMVLIEGLSFGCVPISFNSFMSVYDIIEDTKNGFIIKSYKLKDYEKKIRQLFDNNILRENMMKEALSSSCKFGLEKITSKWNELFNQLLNEALDE